jgi:predicted kinase
VRSLLGGWMTHPTESGLLARRVALEMAQVVLESGWDVIVPQFLARADFIIELEARAEESGAAFVEIALTADLLDVLAWFESRSVCPETTSHVDAQRLLDRTGGVEELRHMVERWEGLMSSRPAVHRIPARVGDVDATYERVIRILATVG